MPALSAKSKTDFFDIRSRLIVSLIVTSATLYLSSTITLAVMAALTLLYLLQTRRYVLTLAAYALVAVMTLLSIAIIFGSFRLFECMLAGTKSAAMLAAFKPRILGNFHTPFLRSLPSMNVLLAVALNFSVQGFVGTMKSVRLPRFLFIPLLVFCRFVPEFADVVRQLRDAVRMRGFSVGFGSAFLHPFQTIRLTVVPLVVRTLRMADNLSMAAEMKRVGYAKHPTQLQTLRFRRADFWLMGATAVLAIAICFWESRIPKPVRGARPAAVQRSAK